MYTVINQPLSCKNVCRTLTQNGIISLAQAEKIMDKQKRLGRQSIKRKNGHTYHDPSELKKQNGVSIIDEITSLNLARADDATRIIDEETIYQTLSSTWGIPYKKINPLKLDLNLVTSTIPKSFARKHLVLPIAVEDGQLVVATANPFNMDVFQDIERATCKKVKVVLSSKSDILQLIDEFFGFKRSIAAAETQFSGPSVDLGNLEQYVGLRSEDDLASNDKHIVNAVGHLFKYAFDQRASDIHIEPKRDVSLVRLRIDGVLHVIYELPKNVHSAVITRIKIMARMDMSEKRRPQDGRIKTDKGGVDVELRVSTVPVAFGEKVVIRIMDPDILFQDLEQLGFSPTDLIRYNRCISMPHGIVLVCGPTGSGKSTTLYSTLRNLSSSENNVTTVEDPIEMVYEPFNQIAVQPGINVTFSSILRNILRQDPDIIMIGEMRDLETAQNAAQAALTGHLVLSTLHTNDAPSSVTRLLDLGIPAFLVQATLIGILGQRLIRKVCQNCKEAFEIDSAELLGMGLETGKTGLIKLYHGKGCHKCRGTGYRGRTGVFEFLPYTETLKKETHEHTDLEVLRSQAKQVGMVSLRENAIKKMLAGVTTYQEVLKVTWEEDTS